MPTTNNLLQMWSALRLSLWHYTEKFDTLYDQQVSPHRQKMTTWGIFLLQEEKNDNVGNYHAVESFSGLFLQLKSGSNLLDSQV